MSGKPRQPDAESLGLDGFPEPDDQGLSLNELSQAYAALLKKGADAYPQSESAEEHPAAESLVEASQATVRADDEAAGDVTPRSILEAILFVGHPTGEPLASERIARLMRGVRPAEIDDLVVELNAQYEAEGAPYAIVSVGYGYQLALRPAFAAMRDAFYGRIREARLSQAAIDILAIVAYRQPIAGDEIDRLRGRPSAGILAHLVRRDLLSLQRGEQRGPVHYRTTNRFLGLFGLEGLDELPRSREMD